MHRQLSHHFNGKEVKHRIVSIDVSIRKCPYFWGGNLWLILPKKAIKEKKASPRCKRSPKWANVERREQTVFLPEYNEQEYIIVGEDRKDLTRDEERLYNLIVKRVLAADSHWTLTFRVKSFYRVSEPRKRFRGFYSVSNPSSFQFPIRRP